MKKLFCAVCLFALVLSCAGCTVPVPPAQNAQDGGAGMPAPPSAVSGAAAGAAPGAEASSAEASSAGASSGGAAETPIRYLGQGEPLGDGNEAGYYYLSHREDGSFNIKYVDYASCTEIYLCSRPECAHDNESCTAWRPYGGSEGCAVPVGDHLYTMFYGPLRPEELAVFGELAKMHIGISGLDGSGARELVSLPASESLHDGIAADAQHLYMTIETVEKTPDDETRSFRQIYAVDLQDGSISKSAPMEQNNLGIVGAAGRKLILRYYDVTLDETHSLADMGDVYCTYDVDTGELHALTGSVPAGYICADEYLCRIDREQACLQKMNVLTGETVSLPFDRDLSRYEDIRPSCSAMPDYILILLYEPDQPVQHGLLSLETGEIFLRTMEIEAPEGSHDKTAPIFAQIDEKTFLTARSYANRVVQFPLGDGGALGLPYPEYELALLPVESCLANRPDFTPIQKVGP